MARTSTRPKKSVSVNFKGVESRTLFPEDDYRLACSAVKQTQSSAGNDQLEFSFKIADGKFEGKTLPPFYCPLTENSLWKLHGLLTALGVEVPDDDMDIELEDLVGLELMGIVAHETYDGTKRSKMVDFYAIEDDEPEAPPAKGGKKKPVDDDDDEPAPKGKAKAKPADDDDDDGADDAAAKRKARRDARKAKASGGGKSKPSDDEDEDEPKAKPKASAKKKAKEEPEPISADAIGDMDEDELEETIEKYDLDIDLSDFKTLRKKAAAVVDALEDAGMIED